MVDIANQSNIKGLAQDFQDLSKIEQTELGKFESFMTKVNNWIDSKVESFVNQSSLINTLEKIDRALETVSLDIAQEIKHEKQLEAEKIAAIEKMNLLRK